MDYQNAKDKAQSMANVEQGVCHMYRVHYGWDAWWTVPEGGEQTEVIEPQYHTIDDICRRNHRAGGHYFEPSTMRFFSSRVQSTIYPDGKGGAYFVTSERGPQGPRSHTVRYARADGDCGTAKDGSGFQAHRTGRQAHGEARRLAARSATNVRRITLCQRLR